MSSFLSVVDTLPTGKRGAIASTGAEIDSAIMAADAPAGVVLVADTYGTDARVAKVPAAAADLDNVLGVGVLHSFRSATSAGLELKADRSENYLFVGDVWAVCEASTMTPEKPVFVRHTANGAGKTQLGAVRGDSDGGDVVTFTVNTATNSTEYTLTLDGITFKYTADSSTSTTEIAVGLAAAIDAHANYTVPVPSTAVFVVTKVAGSPADPVITALDSRVTAVSGATAAKVPGLRFYTPETAAGVVKIRVNLPTA